MVKKLLLNKILLPLVQILPTLVHCIFGQHQDTLYMLCPSTFIYSLPIAWYTVSSFLSRKILVIFQGLAQLLPPLWHFLKPSKQNSSILHMCSPSSLLLLLIETYHIKLFLTFGICEFIIHNFNYLQMTLKICVTFIWAGHTFNSCIWYYRSC